jgi:hypothetical protein
MKFTYFLLIILFCSCSKKNDKKVYEKLSGLYEVESESNGETGNIYVFGDGELHHFVKDWGGNNCHIHRATFKFYVKNDIVYTCKINSSNCDEAKYNEQYKLISIDTLGNEQIVSLTSDLDSIKLKKTFKYD